MKKEKKLIRLISARADIHLAQEAYCIFKALNDLHREALKDHLFASMVLSYGRPFTENQGVGNLKCEYPNFPDYEEEKLNEIHRRLIDLRNKFVAHSSIEGTQVEIIPPKVTNPLTGKMNSEFDYNIGKRKFDRPEYMDQLYKGIDTLMHKLDLDIKTLLNENYGNNRELTAPFKIETGHENFKWTEE